MDGNSIFAPYWLSDLRSSSHPASNYLYVDGSDLNNALLKVSVRDITGRIVTSEPKPEKNVVKMDIAAVPPGIYVLEIRTSRGNLRKKITIRR